MSQLARSNEPNTHDVALLTCGGLGNLTFHPLLQDLVKSNEKRPGSNPQTTNDDEKFPLTLSDGWLQPDVEAGTGLQPDYVPFLTKTLSFYLNVHRAKGTELETTAQNQVSQDFTCLQC